MVRKILIVLVLVVAAATALFFAGPRVAADTTVRFDAAVIGPVPEAYLQRTEGAVAGIRPGLEKQVVWADPARKARTPFSIVYVHGFSASKQEIRPLPDRVAAALGANLFFTRLTGHGMDGPAMATGSVNSWINDYAEALAIGRAIGERVIVLGTSTGASLASWGATRPDLMKDVAALVLVSPNYGARAAGAELLTMPWGLQIAHLVAGTERSFTPLNEAHGRYWTTRYPMSAVLPMAATTDLAFGAPVEQAKIPALFVFSDADQGGRAERTRLIAARWGAPHEIVSVEASGDPSNHVIAGDALSPQTTEALSQAVGDWLRRMLPAPG